jgi:lysophospholipase L1-like esterase
MKNTETDFPDKIHPNEDGARKMAEIIADQIR